MNPDDEDVGDSNGVEHVNMYKEGANALGAQSASAAALAVYGEEVPVDSLATDYTHLAALATASGEDVTVVDVANEFDDEVLNINDVISSSTKRTASNRGRKRKRDAITESDLEEMRNLDMESRKAKLKQYNRTDLRNLATANGISGNMLNHAEELASFLGAQSNFERITTVE
uniref:Uncharacterized protein n=1 Tax=Aureoumbra lagunensis TaxID=44058 RepID=A0A6S8EAG8_9STRA